MDKNINNNVGVQQHDNLSLLAKKFTEKIEECRVSVKTKLNDLVHEYEKIDKDDNTDAKLLAERIAILKELAPQIECKMNRRLKNHIAKIKSENRRVMRDSFNIHENRKKENKNQEFQEWYNKAVQKWDDDIEKIEKENQDDYAKVRNLLSKIDWNNNDWHKHISEFKKLDREVIRHVSLCNKSISSLERMFLHYVELGQNFEQNALIASIPDTIGKINRSLARTMEFVDKAYKLERELEQLYEDRDYQEEMFLLKNIIKSDLIRTQRNEKIHKALNSISTVHSLLMRLPVICDHDNFARKFHDINLRINEISSLFKTTSYGRMQAIHTWNDERKHDFKFNMARIKFDTLCGILSRSIENDINDIRPKGLPFRDRCHQLMIKTANAYKDLKNEIAKFNKELNSI